MTRERKKMLKREAKRYTESRFPVKYRPTSPEWWLQTFLLQRLLEFMVETSA